MKKRLFFIAGLILFIAGFSLFAQSQADRDARKGDVVVILDVSGSMNEQNKFNNVKDYLERDVVDSLLKTGDNFTMVVFGESSREQFSRTINSDSDRAALKADIRRMEPTDNYTDIGMAMEKCAEIIEQPEKADYRRIILFITDGINAPPSASKYQGADISMDDRYKTLGNRISKGSWFLYVIGIGDKTAAQDISGLIPGSEHLTTDANVSDADFAARVKQQEEEERAREAELRRLEEERRLAEQRDAGFMGFLRRLAVSLGISLPVLIACLVFIFLLLILLAILIIRSFRVRELVIADESETLIKKINAFGSILLNSSAAILPGLGNEYSQVIRIGRGISNFSVQILDSAAIADTSPYKKQGTYSLKGVIALANGHIVRVTVR